MAKSQRPPTGGTVQQMRGPVCGAADPRISRRRMPKQLYIALPCAAVRESLLQRQLGPSGGVRASLSNDDMAKIEAKTAGYPRSDMHDVIQKAR